MSSFDGQDLGQQVDRALATIVAGPAPAGAIVARGRRYRRRRRAARAGAVAVVAALAVAIPGLVYTVVRSGPPGPTGQLTIAKLDPIARNGVIGSGSADGKPWTVRLAGGPDPVATAAGLPSTGRLGARPGGSDPVTLHVAGSGARRLLAGPVSPGVAYLTMRSAGGTTYRLYPVAWHGHHYVGLVLPWNLPVARFTAYSRHGELGYAIPFPDTFDFPRVVSWLRPGASVPAVSSATVGTGFDARLNNYHWSVQVQVGPWGTCLQDSSGYLGTWCRPTATYPPNAVTLVMSGPLGEEAGITGRAVAYIQLRLRNGKTTRLHVLHIGGQGFYALSTAIDHVAGWTAYTATGHVIASGTGTPG